MLNDEEPLRVMQSSSNTALSDTAISVEFPAVVNSTLCLTNSAASRYTMVAMDNQVGREPEGCRLISVNFATTFPDSSMESGKLSSRCSAFFS